MSQADYHPDSSVAVPAGDGSSLKPPHPAPPNPDANRPRPQVPPPPPSGDVPPATPSTAPTRAAVPAPPPPPAANAPATSAAQANRATQANPTAAPRNRAAAVPPPPPPRSTLPPVRPGGDPKQLSGVGSAKGVRWRGEVERVGKTSHAGATGNRGSAAGREEGEEDEAPLEDAKLTKEAPPWLVSMVFHLIVLLVLALISSPAGTGLGKVMLTIGQSDQKSPSEFTEFAMATEFSLDDAESMEESEVDVDVESVFDSFDGESASELAPVELGLGPEIAVAKPMFNGRSGAMKQALLAIYGGTPETQAAVSSGLAWLKRNQRRDGSWSMRGPFSDGGLSENTIAATSMALLAFLGDGNTHKKGEYADVVDKGIKYLIGKQDRKGFFAREARGHEKMYAQAQASIAVCELYAMSKDSWLRPRAELALEFAIESQSPEGGWRYEPGFDSDTSVTGWFVMALQSGRSAGLANMVSDTNVMENVDGYLDSAASDEGATYGYQARGAPTNAMTAEGILCRQYISWQHDNPSMRLGIDTLLARYPFDISDRDVYYWYYATQVLHHYGGDPWREWNESMRVQLPKAQIKGGKEDGSWAPQQDRWGSNSGRLYTTCLSIYCLEVYYRHMPLYQSEKVKLGGRERGSLTPLP